MNVLEKEYSETQKRLLKYSITMHQIGYCVVIRVQCITVASEVVSASSNSNSPLPMIARRQFCGRIKRNIRDFLVNYMKDVIFRDFFEHDLLHRNWTVRICSIESLKAHPDIFKNLLLFFTFFILFARLLHLYYISSLFRSS